MPKQISCADRKKIHSKIRQKLTGALRNLAKDEPRSAATKLFEAAELIKKTTKDFWGSKPSLTLGNEASYIAFQLVKPSMMYWPKWKDEAQEILKMFDRAASLTTARCGK